MNQTRKWFCSQMGARMHYAVPRMLYGAGLLQRFYTDFYANKGWPKLLHLLPAPCRPEPVRRLLNRAPAGIDPERITAFNGFGREYARRRKQAGTPTEQTATHLWAGREFCRRVIEHEVNGARGDYCFNSAGLEILQRARQEGRKAVVEQTIAPRRIERQLLEMERERFPDWEPHGGEDALADEFIEREASEWLAADVILCGSEFVREGIRLCDGPMEKCIVVPYGVDLPAARAKRVEGRKEGALRVLTVGTIGLRKGAPYVLAAAKYLKGKAVFRMVGNVGVTPEVQAQLRKHLELTGPVPRSEIAKHFEWADVFLLPSICEGSATVTYEAMGYGLPVICTPSTGSVARDDVEGCIVPERNVDRIVARLQTVAQDSAWLERLSVNAWHRANEYTIANYSRRLLAVLQEQ